MSPLFVSYFTPAYRHEAAQLTDTLDRFGLMHCVQAVADRGTWELNCAMKPAFIRRMMISTDKPIVWIDADGRVVQAPKLFDTLDCDMACHFRHDVELLSGTMFFNNTASASDLLVAWAKECEANPGEWDQRTLHRVIEAGSWNVTKLPASYTAIFDDPKMMEDAVIVHGQASRRLRDSRPSCNRV
jgi:hypothetical protein